MNQHDLGTSNRVDSRDDRRMNCLLQELYHVELKMASVTMSRHQLDIAEGHCQRSLAYLRRYGLEGETKTTNILGVLRRYCSLRGLQSNYSDTTLFAKVAYNLVVEAYDCIHPQIQEAVGELIDILTSKGD